MDNIPLNQKRCIPCEGGTPKMNEKEAVVYIEKVNEWQLNGDTSLQKLFIKKDFKEALRFVNAIGDIAEKEGQHPDICIEKWNRVRITLSTHAIGGLSENDFILASKIDTLEHNH